MDEEARYTRGELEQRFRERQPEFLDALRALMRVAVDRGVIQRTGRYCIPFGEPQIVQNIEIGLETLPFGNNRLAALE